MSLFHQMLAYKSCTQWYDTVINTMPYMDIALQVLFSHDIYVLFMDDKAFHHCRLIC